MKQELKNCPFCSCEAAEWNWHSPVEGSTAVGCESDYCVYQPWNSYEKREDAIAAWNNRAVDPLTAELLEALVALRDAVKDSGLMNDRRYVSLGIQVNDAIAKAKGAAA